MFKKIIALLIILSLVILPMTSCSEKTESSKPSLENSNESMPIISRKPTGDSLHFYYPTTAIMSRDMTEETRLLYEEYLTKVTGYKVSYDYISATLNFLDEDMKEYQEQGGFIYVDSYTKLLTLIEQDLIVPLNEYYDSNSNFKLIDQSYIQSFTDDSGNIFAIPTHGIKYYVNRTYDSEWLEILSEKVPQNINEFTLLAHKIRSDIDVIDGKQPYITVVSDSTAIPYFFKDIFAAFECYLNFAGVINVNYNEHTKLYEDITVKSSFKEALTYVKYLFDNDLIAISHEGYTVVETSKYTSMCYFDGREGEVSLFLENENSSGIISENIFTSGWAMLNNTENKDEKISFLLNQVMVEKPLLEAFNYGIKNFHFEEKDDYYLTYDVNELDKFIFTAMRIDTINNLGEEKPVFMKNATLEDSENYYYATLHRKQKTEEIVSENPALIYRVDPKKVIQYDYSDTKQSTVIEGFYNIFKDIFEKDILIEDAIETYKSKVNDSYINQLNSN